MSGPAALRTVSETGGPAVGSGRAGCGGRDDTGLELPPGFCATVFADGIGHARHLTVAPNGVVYVNTWFSNYYPDAVPHAGGFLVALQDRTGRGRADRILRFGPTFRQRAAGGTGIAWYRDRLYAEINDRIVRYSLTGGEIVPSAPPETVVSGLPLGGDHPMHPFAIDAAGALYVDVGTATNSCQPKNRTRYSPGARPCVELKTRGGIWRFDANRTGQVFSKAARYATGIRNAEGIAIDPTTNRIYVTQHGRDQLYSNWPKYYAPSDEATLPAEEVLRLQAGGDYGWPECYYDPFRGRLVLAPEYGGDGGNKIGVCAHKIGPVAAYPAHWAPDDMVYYDAKQFPQPYRDGLFIAFHGSWNRAPYGQQGYNVVYQPLVDGRASGRCEIFADGFAGAVRSPDQARHRPAGLAVGPDGSLYVADDVRGRIYRIVYRGGGADAGAHLRPCPSAATPAGPEVRAAAETKSTAAAPVPAGATPELVALGERIFRGETGGAACAGCHGANGAGGPLGPNLADSEWLWSDGSYAGIERTIAAGVAHPKRYRQPMPAMGGASLDKRELDAVAAYVWTLSRRSR